MVSAEHRPRAICAASRSTNSRRRWPCQDHGSLIGPACTVTALGRLSRRYTTNSSVSSTIASYWKAARPRALRREALLAAIAWNVTTSYLLRVGVRGRLLAANELPLGAGRQLDSGSHRTPLPRTDCHTRANRAGLSACRIGDGDAPYSATPDRAVPPPPPARSSPPNRQS